ncbi:chloride channel protein [Parasynechococcus sp.]|uniref:chloride channel protein n=1 Tax=Parasynechococcus sp. TaxID=3101203 RepID=UPI0037037DEC
MHWLPLVPFAGEDQLRPLLEGQNSSEAWVLLLSAIVKLLMLGFCLETGWRGGVFFPLFLVACALGMGLDSCCRIWAALAAGAVPSQVRCTAACLLYPWRFLCSGLPSSRATGPPAYWWALIWRT